MSTHIVGPTAVASFDVQSLYTNVPLKGNNHIIIEIYFEFNNNQYLDEKLFTKLPKAFQNPFHLLYLMQIKLDQHG